MGEDIDHPQTHHRRQSYGRPHVVGEHQKGPAIRDQAPIERDAVHHRAHGVLAHPIMDIAPSPILLAERFLALNVGLVGTRQVSRAPHELRQMGGQGVEHFTRGDACGQAFGILFEGGDMVSQALRKLARQGALEGGRQIGIGLAILLQELAPSPMLAAAALGG
jgi:hypothetical protein